MSAATPRVSTSAAPPIDFSPSYPRNRKREFLRNACLECSGASSGIAASSSSTKASMRQSRQGHHFGYVLPHIFVQGIRNLADDAADSFLIRSNSSMGASSRHARHASILRAIPFSSSAAASAPAMSLTEPGIRLPCQRRRGMIYSPPAFTPFTYIQDDEQD